MFRRRTSEEECAKAIQTGRKRRKEPVRGAWHKKGRWMKEREKNERKGGENILLKIERCGLVSSSEKL